jgi:hypothetical protein
LQGGAEANPLFFYVITLVTGMRESFLANPSLEYGLRFDVTGFANSLKFFAF